MTSDTAALAAVILGRDERVRVQLCLLSGRIDYFVCQIALNVPGYPKRLPGDEAVIEKCREDFKIGVCCELIKEVQLENGAGLALLMLFGGGKEKMYKAKQAGIFIEENKRYGRIVDIDVVTVAGSISRRDFYFGPRRCLLCSRDSKECSRERNHRYEELRAVVQDLINEVS